MTLLMVGCASLPGPGKSHSGMEWQEAVKLAGLRGDPLVVSFADFGPVEGAGEYPGAIEWSGKGQGFYGERVEVVLNEEELAFIWWNPHLEEIVLLRDYSLSLSEIDRIYIEDDPEITPDGYSKGSDALNAAIRILGPAPPICQAKHFYVIAGTRVVQFSVRDFSAKYGPILDFLTDKSGIEVWEKPCYGKLKQLSADLGKSLRGNGSHTLV